MAMKTRASTTLVSRTPRNTEVKPTDWNQR